MLWFLIQSGFAAKIQGKILQEQKLIAEAEIFCISAPENVVNSDEHGSFDIDIPENCPSLRIVHPDFYPLELFVSDIKQPVVIQLQALENSILVEDWSEHAETGSQFVLGREEMHDIPVRTAEGVLRQVPGFILIQHGSEGKGHQFYLRGFDAAHGADLELTVEGIPINEWSNVHAQGYLDLALLGNEVLESVWVSKGSFLPEQGMFGTGGSVEYQLMNPLSHSSQKQKASLTLGNGNRQELALLLSPSKKHREDFLSVSLTKSDGIGMNRSLQRQTLQYKQTLFENEALQSKLLILGNHSNFGMPTPLKSADIVAGEIDIFDSYQEGLVGQSSRLILGIQNRMNIGEFSVSADIHSSLRYLSLLENYTGFLFHEEGDNRKQEEQHISQGSRIVVQKDSAMGLLQLGARQHWSKLQQNQEWRDTDEAPEEALFQQQYVQSWVGLRANLFEKWQLIPSLNWFYIDSPDINFQQKHYVLPRVVNEWIVGRHNSLFFSYGQGIRPPNIRNQLLSSGQTSYQTASDISDPVATITQNLELGWKTAGENIQAQLVGYLILVPQEAIFDHVAGTTIESQATQREGVEVNTRMERKDWMLFTSFNWVQAHFRDSTEPLPLIPAWNIQFKLSKRQGNWNIASLALFRTAKPLGFGAEGQTYFRQDLSLQYNPGTQKLKNIDLRLDIENIWNQQIYVGEYWYASQWLEGGSALSSIHVSPDLPRMLRMNISTQW